MYVSSKPAVSRSTGMASKPCTEGTEDKEGNKDRESDGEIKQGKEDKEGDEDSTGEGGGGDKEAGTPGQNRGDYTTAQK